MSRLRDLLSPIGSMHVRETRSVLDRAIARVRRLPDRYFLARVGQLDALRRLGASVSDSAPAASGPRVLVLALRFMPDHLAFETAMAQALRLRGAEVTLLTCGGGPPVCEVGWARKAWPRPCDRCAFHTDRTAEAARLPQRRLADLLPWGGDGRDAPSGAVPDPAAREVASISVPWFLRAVDTTPLPDAQDAIEDFQVTVEGATAAAHRVLDETTPEIVVMLNGLFAMERAIAGVAESRGIRVVTYEIAPRAAHLVFSQEQPAPEFEMSPLWDLVKDRQLTQEQEDALDAQLAGRVSGRTAHEVYFGDSTDSLDELDLPNGARIVSLFTNLSWDSACIGHDVAYPSMLDWMAGAVSAASQVDDVVLVIRVHPAEDRWHTRERAEDGLRQRVGELPPNVRFVGPDEPVSSYALIGVSDLVLTYTTTVGLEAAVGGVPVAVAGDTHYGGRGFTIDLSDHDDLVRAMAAPSTRLTDEERERARRYAFMFFFRAMLPIPPVHVSAGHVHRMPADADELRPGRDPHLDWVVSRILDGEPFPLPDELTVRAEAAR